MRVAVLGASPESERYANRAQRALLAAGHQVVPVSPSYEEVDGLETVASVGEISEPVHTLTLYVRPAILTGLLDDIVAFAPQRVIFNPGTEHARAQQTLRDAGIEVLEACTLVLLSTDQFTPDSVR